MKKHLRRYAIGALAVGAVASATAIALPANVTAAAEWRPATYGLTETPEQLLPTTVSTRQPVRVVSTTLDADGKPVIKVTTATSSATAAQAVRSAQGAENAVGVELDAIATATEVPTGTDTYRSQQWDFSKIHVANAWRVSTGAGVTVAVIDTGVDASNPDLAGQVLAGYDAIANTAGAATDPNGHGTHVAGTIAALTGNGAGVSAIAPDARILPIRSLGTDGSGYMSDTAEGIIWAADHGAGVINMSLGSDRKVTAVTNAIAYARSKGVVVVAAAGNERAEGSPTSYPAADAGVLGVGATDSADNVATYSNAGSYVDVAAPGTGIISTYPVALGKTYASMSGTSMASPHVAAVAALIRAAKPALTPDEVQAALQSSAVDLGPAGRDDDFGYGRIDAAAALAAAGATAPATSTPTTAPTTAPTVAPTTAPPATPPTTTAPTVAPTTTPPTTTVPTVAPTTVAPSPTPSRTTTTPTPTPSRTTTTPTPTPSRTTTAPKVTPAIQVSTAPASVVYGSTSTITYTVTAAGKPWAGKAVQIGVAGAGTSAFTYKTFTTSSTGKVTVSIRATATFRIQLVVPATVTSTAATSPVTTVTVKAAAKVTTPAKSSLKVTLTGAAGQKVQIQRYERSRWVAVKTFTAQARMTVPGLVSGGTYRVVVPSTTTVTGLTTASVKVA